MISDGEGMKAPEPGLLSEDLLQSLERLGVGMKKLHALMRQIERAQGTLELRVLRQRVPELTQLLEQTLAVTRVTGEQLQECRLPLEGPRVAQYAAEFEQEVRRLGLPLTGGFPEYEAFPLVVRFDLAAEQLLIGRRRYQALQPKAAARILQRAYQTVHGSSFQPDRFLRALTVCYDAFQGGRMTVQEVLLADIYDILSARTGTAGYTRQEFEFDIYRMRHQSDMVYQGRQIRFVHGKKGRKFAIPRAQGGSEEFTALILEAVMAGD